MIMRKNFFILLSLLLVVGLTANAQIKRGDQKKAKTERSTVKKKGTQSTGTQGTARRTRPQKTKAHTGGSTTSRGVSGSSAAQHRLNPVVQRAIDNMVKVEGGTFYMGATSEQKSSAVYDESPSHAVTLRSFSISKYEVTQELWQAVMGSNPSDFTDDSDCPVENVSWSDCQEFITKLNKMTGKHFRLPTEAEWEYAARGGNRTLEYKFAGSNTLDEVGWYDTNSNSTYPVGMLSPNELGLYDMSGNVREWCQDWYGEDYYSESPSSSPAGPTSGDGRVCRGGSWYNNINNCRVSSRFFESASARLNYVGLRLAL